MTVEISLYFLFKFAESDFLYIQTYNVKRDVQIQISLTIEKKTHIHSKEVKDIGNYPTINLLKMGWFCFHFIFLNLGHVSFKRWPIWKGNNIHIFLILWFLWCYIYLFSLLDAFRYVTLLGIILLELKNWRISESHGLFLFCKFSISIKFQAWFIFGLSLESDISVQFALH